MLQRLTINLSKLEQQALETIAAIELRDLRDQARFLLRQELERRGLLVIGDQNANDPKQEGNHVAS